ncbi:MAG: hypothetical protein V4649_03780 [Bacteroidota bacterium]
MTDKTIHSPAIKGGNNLKMGSGCRIVADEVILGDNVVIGNNVELICDRLELGDNCKIGNNTKLLAPEITIADNCSVGKNVAAELNEYLRMGRYSFVGDDVVMAGQGVSCGEFLYLKNDVIIGGGGSAGPNAYLKMGDRVSVFDKVYINLSEEVEIGSDTAISYNAVILTHSTWQPALMGFYTRFAPVKIGSQSVVYLNSVILPGVTIGDYVTIGAQSLVNKDIPSYSLASGNPVKIIVGEGYYPRELGDSGIDSLVHSILDEYKESLGVKGVQLLNAGEGQLKIAYAGKEYTIAYYGHGHTGESTGVPDITMSFAEIADDKKGAIHFDLKELKITGEPGPIGEDLRDFMRRRAIRIFTGKPFKTLPLTNLKRIREKRNKI